MVKIENGEIINSEPNCLKDDHCEPSDCETCYKYQASCNGYEHEESTEEAIGRLTREIKDLTAILNEKWNQYQQEMDEGRAEGI